MLLTTLLLCLPQIAAAEPLLDPTRPAIDLSADAGGEAPVTAPPKGLQSIIISPQYRAAIINGETVRLGGKSGDSRLIEVRENSVVLQNARGRRVMELFPTVSIKKNEAEPQGIRAEEPISGQPSPPEKDAGGFK
jgi:MSHA biogenesis protein MshK